MKKGFFLSALLAACSLIQAQESIEMKVNVSKKGGDISPTMYGLFFEDINFAADGGLYAELIKNRSFDFPYALTGWTAAGRVEIMNDGPFSENPNYARLQPSTHGSKYTALVNEGFFGIGLSQDAEYRFSVYARTGNAARGASLEVQLIDPSAMGERQALASQRIRVGSAEWQKYTVILKSPVTIEKAQLRIFLRGDAHIDIEHVSLFPVDTWKGRENGLRKDLVQALADLKPGIFRFPGGCIVEGTDLETRYNWKNSVGPVENRKLNENRWHYTFDYRFFPDYFQSYGLGFFEYFQLCEDIGAEPLPVISCGLACQFQNGTDAHCDLSEIDSFVQDALDLVEFANGSTDTKWGALRAQMGHPEPFGMKYLAVGNEQWGQEYIDHVKPFLAALRKNCPEIKIVGTAGPYNSGEYFDFLWPQMKALKADLVDEHFYASEDWFINNAGRYDNYDRKGPKVFAGEYACHGTNGKWNTFNAALLEAAFMTGLERNADVVRMATYAPLFAHVEGWQWRPDLIWFDNIRLSRSCSYYVQQLYSLNKGTDMLKLTGTDGKPFTGQDGIYSSAVWDASDNALIVKIANISDSSWTISISVSGLKKKQSLSTVRSTVLAADDIKSDNIPHDKAVLSSETIQPVTVTQSASGSSVTVTAAPKSFQVLRIYSE